MRWERTAAAGSTATPPQVWAALLDGRRWARWHEGIEWMTLEGPLIPGSLMTVKLRRFLQTALRIESVAPERLLAVAVSFGPLASLALRWELAPDGAGTEIRQTIAIAGPCARLLLARRAERIAAAMPANLARLAACAVPDST